MIKSVNLSCKLRIELLASLIIAGCRVHSSDVDQTKTEEQVNAVDDQKQGLIAARVNGAPIFLSEVKNLLSETDDQFTPEEALDILVRNTLLAQEAARRGYAESPEVKAVKTAASARALLKSQITQGITPKNLDKKTLQACFEAEKKRYVHGKKRRVVHFLAKTGANHLSDNEARLIAAKAQKLASSAETEADFLRLVAPVVEKNRKNVVTENLPPFEADNRRYVRPFVEATFQIPEVGDISPPIRTDFGRHIIFLAEEIPAVNRSLEEVKQEVLKSCVPKARRQRTQELMSRLLSENKIFIFEDALKEGNFPQ
jgi:hypothetical protein